MDNYATLVYLFSIASTICLFIVYFANFLAIKIAVLYFESAPSLRPMQKTHHGNTKYNHR